MILLFDCGLHYEIIFIYCQLNQINDIVIFLVKLYVIIIVLVLLFAYKHKQIIVEVLKNK